MKIIISALILYALLISSYASAAMIGFGCITGDSATNCATGEAQLSLEVTDAGNNQILFKFSNSGPAASFISDIYFDNDILDDMVDIGSTLDSIAELQEMLGVDFKTPINGNGDLPGGNAVDFDTTNELEAQNEPGAANGINPGEMLGILFNLQSNKDFADVVSELSDGSLRVGIHVQGFGDGGSESFVTTVVPVPAAVWMLGSGLLAMAGFGRRKVSI